MGAGVAATVVGTGRWGGGRCGEEYIVVGNIRWGTQGQAGSRQAGSETIKMPGHTVSGNTGMAQWRGRVVAVSSGPPPTSTHHHTVTESLVEVCEGEGWGGVCGE